MEKEESGVRQVEEGQTHRATGTQLPRASLYLSERRLIHHHSLQHLLRLPGTKNSPHHVKNGCRLPPGAGLWGCQPGAYPSPHRLMLGTLEASHAAVTVKLNRHHPS